MISLTIYEDVNLTIVTALTMWTSLRWEPHYNSLGTFTLEINKELDPNRVIKKGYFLRRNDDNHLMIITSVMRKGDQLIFSGYSAEWILTKRISTYIAKNDNANTLIQGAVTNSTSYPRFMILYTGTPAPELYRGQTSGQTVYEYLEKICQAVDWGFYSSIAAGMLLLQYYKPSASTAVFSEQFNNVVNIQYTESDVEWHNVARVAGQGTGGDRVYVWAGDTASSGLNRYELYVDARYAQQEDGETLAQYQQRLVEIGLQKLSECAKIQSVTFDVVDDYGAKLGDIVEVRLLDPAVTFTARITAITEVIKASGSSRKITVGAPMLKPYTPIPTT